MGRRCVQAVRQRTGNRREPSVLLLECAGWLRMGRLCHVQVWQRTSLHTMYSAAQLGGGARHRHAVYTATPTFTVCECVRGYEGLRVFISQLSRPSSLGGSVSVPPPRNRRNPMSGFISQA